MKEYKRIFGAGPRGLFISIVLFVIGYFFAKSFPHQIYMTELIGWFCLIFSSTICISIVVWSIISLPTYKRGRILVTNGAFRYFRHPLYAAFLSFFNFGFAIFMNDWIFLLWAVILHPIWHLNVNFEEKLMIDTFGQQYIEYCKKTGRFFPKLIGRGRS